MSLVTTLTRAYLTRTTKPFRFTRDSDKVLPYRDCDGLGLYVHIPFCRSICNFCPYCKTIYGREDCDRYVDALLQEIRMVGAMHQGKKTVTSLYFGGGSPALAVDRIGEIVEVISSHFTITDGIGLELHPDDVTVPVLEALKRAGVTRISIGVQSFQKGCQKALGRKPIDTDALKAALSLVPFDTVSMDFIFALPSQTLDDLKSDIDTAFEIGANHVAIYPFIDFTFTKSRVRPMPKKEKRALLDGVTRYCLSLGCVRNSIWTFAKSEDARYSSMTRDNFLGFGCSATTLLKDSFKINTFSVEEYERCIDENRLPTALTCRFEKRQRMVYYLFWTAYSTRVRSSDFEAFFGVSLERRYGFELWVARCLGFIRKKGDAYEMTLRGAFYYHYYESFYTLAYIDKMWGILRKEAFPEKIEL